MAVNFVTMAAKGFQNGIEVLPRERACSPVAFRLQPPPRHVCPASVMIFRMNA